MRVADLMTRLFLILGGLDLGMFGLFKLDFIAASLGGKEALLPRGIFIIVGICALWQLLRFAQAD